MIPGVEASGKRARFAVVPVPDGADPASSLVPLHSEVPLPRVVGPDASPSRLVRDCRKDQTPIAIITFPQFGGPIRNLVGQGHSVPIGIYRSWKNGWAQPWTGYTHRQLLHLLDVAPGCDDYQSEPFTIRVATPHGPMEMTPDVLLQRRSGTIKTIEVKYDRRGLHKPLYREKLAYAFAALRSIGWDASVRYALDIYGPPARVANVDAIQGDKTAAVDEDALDRFEELARSSPETRLGDVLRTMSGNRLTARAWTHAMICDRRIAVDLDRPMLDDTPVRILPDRRVRSAIRF